MAPVKITFRGVCLYLAEGGELRVLFPNTSGSNNDCQTRGEHFAEVAIHRGGVPPTSSINFDGCDLIITAPGKLTIVHPGGFLNLGNIVDKHAEVSLLPDRTVGTGRRLNATVTLRGDGLASPVTSSKETFHVADSLGNTGNFDPHPRLELEWRALTEGQVIIRGIPGNDPLTVNPDDEVFIGHYDDQKDAVSPVIKPRPCRTTNNFLDDVDFYWLYTLLDGLSNADTAPLPRTMEVTPAPPPGQPGPETATTSTCFGATWPRT